MLHRLRKTYADTLHEQAVSANIIRTWHHVNPEKWQPLIYNFRHYFGLGSELGKTFRAEI